MKTLLELEPSDCRFPYGEGDFRFCTKPRRVYLRFERLCVSPWCEEHFLICTMEPPPKKVAA